MSKDDRIAELEAELGQQVTSNTIAAMRIAELESENAKLAEIYDTQAAEIKRLKARSAQEGADQ
tara:strand:+ start:1765 stop:1956 length:192 start_codon:yes stop_codon:yes gene_type:complete